MTQVRIVTEDDLHRAIAPLEAQLARLVTAIESAQVRPKPAWLSVKDYARLLGVTERTVRRHIKDGRLEARRIGGAIRLKRP